MVGNRRVGKWWETEWEGDGGMEKGGEGMAGRGRTKG